jgi:hypothetical protein
LRGLSLIQHPPPAPKRPEVAYSHRDAGNCLLDLGFGLYRRPHYIVVVGFDDENAVIGMHGIHANSVMG